MRIYYKLTTIDPVVMSASNATTNNHSCLDYIPGSAILGALASRHYPKLSRNQSWQAFHSGHTRFSPCYPTDNAQLYLPTPASWHIPKGKDALESSSSRNKRYNVSALSNHAANNFQRQNTTQYEQCRSGYVNAQAQAKEIQIEISTKTAIDRKTGIAAQSQLFSYAFIPSGQAFAGWVESDDLEIMNELKQSLQGSLRLGRSRNSEFGLVKLEVIASPALNTIENDPKRLVLWCLSDCELLSDNGLPTFTPRLESLIPYAKGQLNSAKSFIRTNRIRRFNQVRRGLDTEQHIISKGSVLVYDLHTPLADTQLAQLAQYGVGINQQQGLGWVSVNPTWSNQADFFNLNELFTPLSIEAAQPTNNSLSQCTSSRLIDWVNSWNKQDEQNQKDQTTIDLLLQKLILAYRNARQYNNILNTQSVGPSSNQWRRIGDHIRNNNSNWVKAAFNGEHAICKPKNDEFGWGIEWYQEGKFNCFADFTHGLLADKSNELMIKFLEAFGRYDLSTFSGLRKCAKELKIDLDGEKAAEANV